MKKSGHGKHLELLLHKLQNRCTVQPASGLNLFKTFRKAAGSATMEISRLEFHHCCKILGMPMAEDEVDALYYDIDTNRTGAIDPEDFRMGVEEGLGELGRTDQHTVHHVAGRS